MIAPDTNRSHFAQHRASLFDAFTHLENIADYNYMVNLLFAEPIESGAQVLKMFVDVC